MVVIWVCLIASEAELISICLLAIYVFWKSVSSVLLPIFQLCVCVCVCVCVSVCVCVWLCVLVTCMSSSNILDIRPLSETLFSNIFSYSANCFFALLMVSFVLQKLLSWIQSLAFNFVFTFLAWQVKAIKTSLSPSSTFVFYYTGYCFWSYILFIDPFSDNCSI